VRKREKSYELLGANVLEWEFESGFRVLQIRDDHAKQTIGMLTIRGGSSERMYEKDGTVQTAPLGIGHFLEHSLFDREDGKVHAKFAKYGALSNAYTEYASTSFFFSTKHHVKECLETLLDATCTARFTEEMVERERSVILHELAMYERHPDYRADLVLMDAVSGGQGERFNILGTTDSLRQVDSGLLRDFHQAYYRPERMVLVLHGKLERQMVETVLSNFADMTAESKAAGAVPHCEIDAHVRSLPPLVKKMGFGQELAKLGWKIPLAMGHDRIKLLASLQVAFEAAFGRASTFSVRLMDEGRTVEPLTLCTELLESELYLLVEAKGTGLATLADEVREEVQRLLSAGIPESAVTRAKHKLFGEWVLMYDDIHGFLYEFSQMTTKGTPLHEFLPKMNGLQAAEVKKMIRTSLCDDFFSSVLFS
jgi:predicted Zn-dependent peptidase